MIYKPYGKIGINVSAVGFGGMRFKSDESIEESAQLVQYAHSKGINYFDTAPLYCDSKSEKIFGHAFKHMKRSDFYVSTKQYPEQIKSVDDALDTVKRSLDNMCIDKIDFFHVWCVRTMQNYENAIEQGRLYDGLLKAKEMGLVDHIVISSHMPGKENSEILKTKRFDGILLGVNILNFPFRWKAVETAHEMGYGVVVMNPLAGGMIPKHQDKLQFLAKNGQTPVEAALEFCIGSKEITIALVGFSTKEHIDLACKVADNAKPLSKQEFERISSMVGQNMNTACTGCGYCDDCPQGIAVPGYMQEYNSFHIFGADEQRMSDTFNKDREWSLVARSLAKAKDCIECGACEEACTQHLPIINRLKQISDWEI